MKWESALEEIKSLMDCSEFSVIISYIADQDLLENILECGNKFGKNMILITENPDKFWYPYEPPYTVISKQQLRSIDPERSLHGKIFLFGRSLGDGTHLLRCLIGSCNATVQGFCKNIEFWAAFDGMIDLSKLESKPFIHMLLNEAVSPDFIDLQSLCKEDENYCVLAALIDLVWRLIIDYHGGDSGLSVEDSRCLSDKLIKEETRQIKGILVHTLGENSLANAIEKSIKSVISQSKKQTSLYLVFPYHDRSGIGFIIDACKKAIGLEDKYVEIRLLTPFPPDFENKYLSNESFTELEALKIDDVRIKLFFRFWTGSSRLGVSELVGEEFKDVYGSFPHGKAIVLWNDSDIAEAIVGSANLTKAAISKDPNINLEVAVWERVSAIAREIGKSIEYLWNQSVAMSPTMKQRLDEWRNRRKENIEPIGLWVEGLDSLKKYVKVKLLKDRQLSFERKIYTDEISKSCLSIRISAQSPKIDVSQIKSIFLPNLDAKKKYETKILQDGNGGIIKFGNIESIPGRLFYQVILPTKFEKEAILKIKQKRLNGSYKLEMRSPPFNKDRYKAMLMIKTPTGWKEYEVISEDEPNLSAQISEKSMTEYATLRLYTKSTTDRPIGWDSVTLLKRRPEIILEKSCACPNAICFQLKEKEEANSARLLTDTIRVNMLLDQDQKAIEDQPIQVLNEIQEEPYVVSFYLGFENNPLLYLQEICMVLRYEDDNSPFRPRSDSYSLFHFQPLRKERGCELDKIFKQILHSDFNIKIRPHQDKILNKAPFQISVKEPKELDFLKHTGAKLAFEWYTTRWGRSSAKSKITIPIQSPTIFEINPSDFIKTFDYYVDPIEFTGMLHVNISVMLHDGWKIPIRKAVYRIRNAREYMSELFGGKSIWPTSLEYITDITALETKLVSLFFETISKAGYELQNEDQLRDYLRFGLNGLPGHFGHSSISCQGVLLDRKSGHILITEIADYIAKNVAIDFLQDENQPKIEEGFFLSEYTKLLRPAIYRSSCRSFNHQRIIFFPNLLLKELGISF